MQSSCRMYQINDMTCFKLIFLGYWVNHVKYIRRRDAVSALAINSHDELSISIAHFPKVSIGTFVSDICNT